MNEKTGKTTDILKCESCGRPHAAIPIEEKEVDMYLAADEWRIVFTCPNTLAKVELTIKKRSSS